MESNQFSAPHRHPRVVVETSTLTSCKQSKPKIWQAFAIIQLCGHHTALFRATRRRPPDGLVYDSLAVCAVDGEDAVGRFASK
jgi:hypothetical protein